MAKLSKLAKKQRRNQMLTLTGIVCAIVTLCTGAIYLALTSEEAPDRETLCPVGGPRGHTIVLVDNTEPFNFIQRQALTQRFRALAGDQIPEGHMLSVFVLGSEFAKNVDPIFERCNPGKGEGKSSLNSNPKRIMKRYTESFRDPLIRLDDEILLDHPSERSPVFEMLQLVSINGFSRINAQGPRKLIVYSDMLPHMPEFSMFHGLPDFKVFKESAYGRKSQATLDGVEINLNYLLNYPEHQTRRQAAFWEQYFENGRASLTQVDVFEG